MLGPRPFVKENNGTQSDQIQFYRIAWSPDWKNYTALSSSSHGRKTNPPWSLDAMATLQQKGPIISRSSFAALDVEEPESEEEPAVVELSPAESEKPTPMTVSGRVLTLNLIQDRTTQAFEECPEEGCPGCSSGEETAGTCCRKVAT